MTVFGALKLAKLSRQKSMMSCSVAECALLQRNEVTKCLAPFFVGSDAHHVGLQHRRMAIEHRLNLNGGKGIPPRK